jgi:solute:Na+ symporter, SSS family
MSGTGFELRTLDVLAIVLYAIAMLVLGWWATSRIKNTEGYFVGGRSVPGWAVGISMLGTAISSITFLAFPGSAYAGNWSRLVPGLMLPVATIIGAYFFVVFFRRTLFISAYQYFEHRFGNWGRSYASLMWSIASLYRMGAILYLMSLPIRLITGWDILTVMIVFGLIITVYTMLGGLEAVIWTDVVQTIVLFIGGLVTVLVVFIKVPGSPLEVLAPAFEAGKFGVAVDLDFSLVRDTFWVLALTGLIGNVQEYSTDQTKIQRYLAADSDRGALTAIWTVGLGCIPLWSLFMFVGTCLWIFYSHHPEAIETAQRVLGTELRADTVFPLFIVTEMPPFVGGLVISAVLAAAMSSIDSSMNGTATVLTTDFYQRHLVTDRDDKHYLVVARVITTILGILAICWAYFLYTLGQGAILDTLMFIGSVLAAGLGGFFMLGFVSNRVNWQGAAIGLGAGVLAIIWNTASHFAVTASGIEVTGYFYLGLEPWLPLAFRVHPFLINVVSNIVVFVVGLIASLFFPKPQIEELQGMTWWTRKMESPTSGESVAHE